jgi:isopentenyl diphosphate isomerase/L-lactate dehydrogenase-like FMN-dependent dehydrogenase
MSTEVLDWKAPVDGGELFAGAIALRFKLSKLGLSRKVASDSITTDADRELVRVGKDILESEAYDAIVKADNDMRAWVAARSIPCPVFESGAYLVKLTAYPMVSKGVREYRDVTRPARAPETTRNRIRSARRSASRRDGSSSARRVR